MSRDRFITDRHAFMAAAGEPQPQSPVFRPQQLPMWETMLAEELAELREAIDHYRAVDPNDADALAAAQAEFCAEGCDAINVLVGLMISQGLPIDAMADAIHAANMAKCVDGRMVRRDDGKILKPAGWQPADKLGVILAARQRQMEKEQG